MADGSGEVHPGAWEDCLKEPITIDKRCRTIPRNKRTPYPRFRIFGEILLGMLLGK
jgi:hypothetical protein